MPSTDQLESSKKRKSDDTAAGPSNTTKRVKPVAANCSNCGVPFVAGDDQDAPCQYHPGHLEARDDDEEDFWADHEEDHFGEIDSDDLKADLTEGYNWDCCDKNGRTEGCLRRSGHSTGRPIEQARLQRMGLKLSNANLEVEDRGARPWEV
ncbi:uncharacterized protein AB675_5350 [Cyphellophora attinorum]|uniref:Uncharacterized protein n=1 Tax=Cyphellophora attinorum TaxID=1664694 RepID=A0A0N1HCF0_9EURO|nr:uncharacterized protein AB675_5350 [Phialophora attinorum]KPI41995.1 hypothetical protein AB675_5350 [Phialophora attinorum]